MVSRRTFMTASVAASAASLLGREKEPTQAGTPQVAASAKAKLTLSFVGGTVLVNDVTHYAALQLSGHGMKTNSGHDLRHQSFIVGPVGTFEGGQPVPEAAAKLLRVVSTAAHDTYESLCLVGKDIIVAGTNAPDIKCRCEKVANYGHVAGTWKRKEPWVPGVGKPVNSRFTLLNGMLVDGTPVNAEGAAALWFIKDSGNKKKLSDVVVLQLEADAITLSGINKSKILVKAGQTLSLAVYSGPLKTHGPKHKYKAISHAILLTSIYDVGTTPYADILPTTDTEVIGEEGKPFPNPCHKGQDEGQVVRVTPDSEYCVNYDELP
jgi:hypothetical protein